MFTNDHVQLFILYRNGIGLVMTMFWVPPKDCPPYRLKLMVCFNPLSNQSDKKKMPQLLCIYLFVLNHYAPVCQANWCNMTFTAGNLVPSQSCIGWPESSPNLFQTQVPAWEADDLPIELSLPPGHKLIHNVFTPN